jgi:SET domain
MLDEDPFGVFSSDDEEGSDNDDIEMNESSSKIAQSLMEKANSNLQSRPCSSNAGIAGGNDYRNIPDEYHPDLSYLERLELDWPQPAYLGPMILVSLADVGGGRGYVAARTLEPGTLVLVEEPAMKWPNEQLGRKLNLISVRHLLEHPTLVRDMELFHPTKDNVDHHANDDSNMEQIGRMLEHLQSDEDEQQKAEVVKLVRLAKERGVTSKDGSELTGVDILRLFLALRYNGLESGVYRHVAMLNHDCHPNCAKLLPQDDQTYSEVRTTRRVLAGESLTISYVPGLMSHASRRKYLWEQHRFDIGAHIKKPFLKMELVGNDLPKSHVQRWEDESIPHRVENATAELEKILEEIQDDINSGQANAETWETLKAMEQSSLELYKEATEQLNNPEHLLLAAVLLIHGEVCEQLRKAPILPLSVQAGILARQVQSLHRLIPLQIASLGKDHFDLARSHLDLENAISELLSRSPKALYELKLPRLSAFDQWSALANLSRREHQRIKKLYPHDAEDSLHRSKEIAGETNYGR